MTAARRIRRSAFVFATAALAACATTPADENDPGGSAASGCSLVDSTRANELFTDREEALGDAAPQSIPGLIVSLREGQETAFRNLEIWATVDQDYEIGERSGDLYYVWFDDINEMYPVMTVLLSSPQIVEYVEYDSYLYPDAVEPNDPCYDFQWHYWRSEVKGEETHVAPGGANLPLAWDVTTGSQAVHVAVLDTGIAVNPDNDPDNIVAGWDFVSSRLISGDGDGRDPDPTDPGDSVQSFHGTHVAGTVGAAFSNNGVEVAGVNWDVSIQPVRVLGTLGGQTSDIIDAIRWAAGLPVPGAATNPTPADVINLSLGGGGGCPRSMQEAVNDATTAGVLVVASAGNSAADASGFSPAGCANVFTVAASDFNGALARYSNFGASVEILAPGGDVNADLNGDGVADGVISTVRDGLANYNGTSMAAPHVAGVAALLLAQDPSLEPNELAARLMNGARPRTPEQCPEACGAGLLDATPRVPFR